jgi:hypothetical protein
MVLKTCVTFLATLGLATAQSSVVSLFIPDTDPQPLAASIVGQVRTYALVEILKLNETDQHPQDAGAVTYSINCPPGTDGSDCGMGPGMWYTSASKTIEWAMSEPDEGLYVVSRSFPMFF